MDSPDQTLPPHVDIDQTDKAALIALYHAVPIADVPPDWDKTAEESVMRVAKADRLARDKLSEEGERALRYKYGPVDLTLPEFMQAFKTLTSFDWMQNLEKELRNEGVVERYPDPDDHVLWPVDEPYERFKQINKAKAFLKWWPIYLGYDVLSGPHGTDKYQGVAVSLFGSVMQQIVRNDLNFVLDTEVFGQAVDYLKHHRGEQDI